ncbi:hypothetical protein PAPHI01_0059 [Pancytospora philotis]|nr:hypothetical protein PAPHI01_0059 [Pancytospora philotis]
MDIDSGRALSILRTAEKAGPGDVETKRLLCELLLRKHRFNEACIAALFVYIKTKRLGDLKQLLCAALADNRLRYLFGDIGIHRFTNNTMLGSLIEMLLRKQSQWDPGALIEKLLSEKSDTAPELLKLNEVPTSSADRMSYAGMRITDSEQFFLHYSTAVRCIQSCRIAEGLAILMALYRQESHYELLEFLAAKEKLELLYVLRRASTFFTAYYERALESIRRARLDALRVLLARNDYARAIQLAETL